MTCQLQLFARREDAQPCERLIFRRLLHKNGLGEIHLPRNRQHGIGGESVCIGNYGEGIPLKAIRGEHIERIEPALHFLSFRASPQRWIIERKSSLATVLSPMILPVFPRI